MIKCVAIDDEPIALSIIQEYCNKYGDIELRCFTSPIEGMDCINSYHPDIVFLDIEMNSHNGLELARELPEEVCLIFTTAYASYALDGFNVDAVDFLHKPIFYPRFEKAIEKARKYMNLSSSDSIVDTVTLKSGHKNVVVSLKDVILVEAMDNYVKIYRKSLPPVVSQITMKDIETLLPDGKFVRIHRSYIISVAYVEKFSNRLVYMTDFQRPVPVGRKYISSFNNLGELVSSCSN